MPGPIRNLLWEVRKVMSAFCSPEGAIVPSQGRTTMGPMNA